jgi:hypothetical protein
MMLKYKIKRITMNLWVSKGRNFLVINFSRNLYHRVNPRANKISSKISVSSLQNSPILFPQ